MRDNITNIANVSGMLRSKKIDLTSNAVITPFDTELTIEKSADKTIWLDGILTFIVDIKNPTSLTFGDVVFDDTIDPLKARLIDNTLTLNGTPIPYTYNSDTGMLSAELEDITPNKELILRFQVEKFKNNWNRLNNEATITWGPTFADSIKSRVCIVLNATNYPLYNRSCCKKIGYIRCC